MGFCFSFWILIDFGIEGCMGFWYLFVVFLFSCLNCGIVGLWDCVFFLFWILELLDFGCVGVWWNSLDVWIWMSFGFWDFWIWGCWDSGGFSFGDLGDLLGLRDVWDFAIYLLCSFFRF